jgi:hypothetical protein
MADGMKYTTTPFNELGHTVKSKQGDVEIFDSVS